MQKADLQPTDGADQNHAFDEIVTQLDDER